MEMSTKREPLLSDEPYRADWENGFSVVRDLNALEGNKIMMMMPDNMEWFADRMNEAFAKGQQFAGAKDAELIQRLVDALWGRKDICEEADARRIALATAASAGFKPTEQP